jgi:CDP-diglyceride synthetase
MLKYRLIFGTLMTIAFIGIVLFDPWAPLLLVILVAALMILGLLELSKLSGAKGVKILLPVSIPISILFVARCYLFPQFMFADTFVFFWLGSAVMACFPYQRIRYGLQGVLVNCGAACFSILSLG